MRLEDEGVSPHAGDRRRVLIVGARRLYLEALGELLDHAQGFAASVVSPTEVATASLDDPPKIVLLDCPAGGTGLVGLATSLGELHPRARVVLLTSGNERESTEQAAALNASGWVSLNLPVSELVHALDDRCAPATGRRTRPRSRPTVSGTFWPLSSLSKREMSVLQLVVDGRSPEEIADQLDISRHTVRTHLQNIMSKLLVRSQTEMVSVARSAGMRARHFEAG
jgi:DNA-binding NarL/FixJ family response regulator